jgi:regulator of sirC expression with transglutaminase-like and TPR domain
MIGEATETLKALGAIEDGDIDLAEGALALAAVGRPSVDLAPYRAHLAAIASDVAPAEGVADRIAALNASLFDRHGYEGDAATYDDLDNANLIRVIDRRKGLPVALGVLYLHAARAQGWAAEGLNFPGHFLLRLDDSRERAIVDPFHGGLRRSPSDLRDLLKASAGADAELSAQLYEPVSNRQVLLRLQNNVTMRLARGGNYEQAIASIDAMILIAPQSSRLWFERGAYHARLGNLGDAIASLDEFIARAPTPGAKSEAVALLATLKRHLH